MARRKEAGLPRNSFIGEIIVLLLKLRNLTRAGDGLQWLVVVRHQWQCVRLLRRCRAGVGRNLATLRWEKQVKEIVSVSNFEKSQACGIAESLQNVFSTNAKRLEGVHVMVDYLYCVSLLRWEGANGYQASSNPQTLSFSSTSSLVSCAAAISDRHQVLQ